MTEANAKEQSRIKYEASKKPAESYTDRSGREVKIKPDDPGVKKVREVITVERYESRPIIIKQYYGPRYDYYYSQPYIHVGGGFSHIFWYSMLEWDLNRRACWLYHHQYDIDQQLYNQQLQNAALRLEIERLRLQGVRPDPTYVDPKMRGNEDLMYSDEFVKAAYNPQPVTVGYVDHGGGGSSGVGTFFIVLLVLTILGVVVYFVFFHDWKSLR
jgi:hypothetical protein